MQFVLPTALKVVWHVYVEAVEACKIVLLIILWPHFVWIKIIQLELDSNLFSQV